MASDDRRGEARIVARWMRELASSFRGGVPLEPFLGSLDVRVLPGHCDYLLDSDDIRDLAEFIDPTCYLTRDKDGYMACANCGCTALCMSDATYCPDCGARVVRADD